MSAESQDPSLIGALSTAWEEVDSGDAGRVAAAVETFRALIPRAIAETGDTGDDYCSAVSGLARALEETGKPAEAREMYGVLAETWERRGAETDLDEERRIWILDQTLRAQALAVLVGADAAQPAPVLTRLDALVARSEAELGGSAGTTLWLLSYRAQFLVRARGEDALDAFDLLIARAAAAGEGERNHLSALADKATALSRLDRDGESAMLWERVLEGRRTLLGMDDPETLDAWWWLARTLWWSGDPVGARREFELLIPALQRVHGEDAPLALNAMRFWASSLQDLGRKDDDGALFQEALELVRRVAVLEAARFGPESRQVLSSRGMAADLIDDLGRSVEAEAEASPLFEEALAGLGPEDPLVVSIGDTRQVIVRRAWARVKDDDPETAERLRATGIAAADQLAELAIAQACAAQREGGDVPARLRSLRRAVRFPVNWWEPEDPEQSDALRRWADRLAALREDLPEQPLLVQSEIELRDRLARNLFEAQRTAEALGEYERSLALERELARIPGAPPGAPRRIAIAQQDVAVAERRLGRTADAEKRLSEALREAAEAGVPEEDLADLRNTRALALQELDRYDEAVVEMRALWESSGDPGRAIDLAVVYLNGERPAEAEALLKPVLATLESEGKGRTPSALRIMGNLALAACKQDRDAEAAVAWERLLAAQREVMGEFHRDTLITLHNRALEEQHLGNHAEAVRRFEEVSRLREEHLGIRDPETLSSLGSFAVAARLAGDLPRARELGERALALSREVLGATHPATLRRARSLEETLEKLGAPAEERERVESEVRAGFSGQDESATLRYADHLLQQNRPGDALLEFARAREQLTAVGGLELLAADRGIAECHRRMGNHRESADAYAALVPRLERQLPDDRWALADALNEQSLALAKLGRVDELVAPQRRAIELAEQAGSDPKRAVMFRVWLGRRLAGHGRHEQALEEYEAAYTAASRVLGDQDPVTLDARDDIAETYAALGRHKEALRIYRKNIPAMAKVFGADSSQVRRAKSRAEASAKKSGVVRNAVILGVIVVVIVMIVWNVAG